MNKEQVITDEMIKEFRCSHVYMAANASLKQQIQAWEDFKASHQTPNEWEVVEFKSNQGVITNHDNDDLKRPYQRWFDTFFSYQSAWNINKVRQISDGETMEAGKEYEFESFAGKKLKGTVEEFTLCADGLINVFFKELPGSFCTKYLTSIVECKEVLFVTEDGKEIYAGDKFWFNLETGSTVSGIAGLATILGTPCYSTERLAKEKAINLSRAMIREAFVRARYHQKAVDRTMEDLEEGLAKLKNKE